MFIRHSAGAKRAALAVLFFFGLQIVFPAYSYAAASGAASVRPYSLEPLYNGSDSFRMKATFQRSFGANDPRFPGKVDYVTKTINVAKRGNPAKWLVKKSAIWLAISGAVAGVGWFIDEAKKSVMHVERHLPSGYKKGYYYASNYNGQVVAGFTAKDTCVNAGATYLADKGVYGQCSWGWWSYNVSQYRCDNGSAAGVPYCGSAEPDLVEEAEPVPEEDVWKAINDAVDANPSLMNEWLYDQDGNPIIYPEVQEAQADLAKDVEGAEPIPDAAVAQTPADATGFAEGDTPTDGESPFSTDFPTDYARKNLQQEQLDEAQKLNDAVKEFTDTSEIDQQPDLNPDSAEENPAKDIYQDLPKETDLPDLPDVPSPGSFGLSHSSSCQTITFSWHSASVVFPNSEQCSKLHSAQDMIGWFLWVVTTFGVIYTILGARALKP